MGNSINKRINNCSYCWLYNDEIEMFRRYYKIIDVDYLDINLINAEICNDKYFIKEPNKKEIINNMIKYYLNDENNELYKKTDYLCNKQNKICICNIHAKDFRKIFNGKDYVNDFKYISWYYEDK